MITQALQRRTIATLAGSQIIGGVGVSAGAAVGANPLSIVVPCHRVLRSDGALGGYRGGAELKRHLLAMEGIHV